MQRAKASRYTFLSGFLEVAGWSRDDQFLTTDGRRREKAIADDEKTDADGSARNVPNKTQGKCNVRSSGNERSARAQPCLDRMLAAAAAAAAPGSFSRSLPAVKLNLSLLYQQLPAE